MSTITVKEPTSYLQKDIIEKQVVSQTYQDQLRTALEFLAEFPDYRPELQSVYLSVWTAVGRF